MLYRRKILKVVGVGWSFLGYKRGIDAYNYTCYQENKPFLYSYGILCGISGALCYVNPFFIPYFLVKESYRLEVNLRDLKDEKNKPNYIEFL